MNTPTKLLLATLALLGLLAASGNRLLAWTLDAALAPLLQDTLGLPVAITPINVDMLRMRATTGELLLGNAGAPAVQAENLQVSLSWRELLRGRVHFTGVTGDSLQLALSRWPDAEEPDGTAATDYLWLRDWLPDRVALQRLVVHREQNAHMAFEQLTWQLREDGTASATGSLHTDAAGIQLRATLDSLTELLAMQSTELSLHGEVADNPQSGITVQALIAPNRETGYTLTAALAAPGISGNLSASGDQAWRLPGQSRVTLNELLPETLASLVTSYFPPQKPSTLAQQLDSSLPQLSLPEHQSSLQVAELRWLGQTFIDTTLDVSTHARGFEIVQLASTAPAGTVQGSGHVHSDHDGWVGAFTATLESSGDTGEEGNADTHPDPEYPVTGLAVASASAELTAHGATWGELVYSLAGEVNAAGNYHHPRAEAEAVPVSLIGRLDSQPGAFALEDLAVGFGNGEITGNVSLQGLKRRTLELELQAHNLDLTFLDEAQNTPAEADDAARNSGQLPAIPAVLAGMDVTANISISHLRAPGMAIATAKAEASITHDQDERWQAALTLDATDYSNGVYRLSAEAGGLASQPSSVAMRADLKQADLPGLLRQSGLPPARASGSLRLQSDSPDAEGPPKTLRVGTEIDLALRPDNNWQRAPLAGEDFQLITNARLALEAGSNERQRLQSLLIDTLSIRGERQDLSGSVSLVRGRTPWLRAAFDSKQLNLPELLALLPEGPEDTGKDTPLSSLRRLASSEVSLNARNVVMSQTNISNVSAKVSSQQDRIDLETLAFDTPGGGFSSTGSLAWEGDNATLQGSATLADVDLDQFLMGGIGADSVPVSGALHFGSSGSSRNELIANLTGELTLASSESAGNASAPSRRQVAMQVERIPDGMQLNVNTFLWGETDLRGRVRYQQGAPVTLSIEVVEGTLSLLPWESRNDNTITSEKKTATGAITEAAKTSASFVGNLVLSPLKMLVGDAPAQAGERLFSPEPLPLDALGDLTIELSGKLDALESRVLRARDIDLAAHIAGRQLSISANSADMSGGQADVTLNFDAGGSVPTLRVRSNFLNVKGLLGEATYPRSGYVALTAEGASMADLAATSSGIVYLELGSGPLDYAQMSLLSADIATSIFHTLLPGFEEEASTLDCGVALLVAEDGIATTPYGLVARTSEANLVGRAELNLKNETMRLKLDSRSREGVGLSVGSVISNTIEVRGPLSDPRVEPNTTGILWRGWAAVMTGGLSVVGESVLKRALASDKPCQRIQGMIQKELCPASSLAAESPLMCPASEAGTP